MARCDSANSTAHSLLTAASPCATKTHGSLPVTLYENAMQILPAEVMKGRGAQRPVKAGEGVGHKPTLPPSNNRDKVGYVSAPRLKQTHFVCLLMCSCR